MRIGFCGHLGQSWSDDPQDVFDALTYAGGKVYRDDFSWGKIEASLGNLAFPGVNANLIAQDSFISLAQAADVETLAILDYGNSLYGPDAPAGYKGGLPLTEAEQAGFANYAQFLAGALAGRQVQYEIWNEWNVPLGATTTERDAGEHLDPSKYYALQAITYPAVKAADPSAFVWAGGFAEPTEYGPARSQWIQSYLSIPDWEQTVDGFGFHHYFGFQNPEVWFWQVRGTAALVRSSAKSKPGIPVAVTETGWFNGTDPNSITEELAADYYSRWPFLLRCTGVNKAVFYDLRNDGLTGDNEDNFGVFSTTYVAKPAATVLADVLPLIHAANGADYWTDGVRHVVILDTGVVAVWCAPVASSSVTINVVASNAGTATIRTAGSTTSDQAIAAGANSIVIGLASRAKILALPAGVIVKKPS